MMSRMEPCTVLVATDSWLGTAKGRDPHPQAVPEFWKRYGAEFDRVTLVARVDGDVTAFADLAEIVEWPSFSTRRRILRSAARGIFRAWTAMSDADAVIVRTPGLVGGLVGLLARVRRRPLFVEVVGDASQAHLPGLPARLEPAGVRAICALQRRVLAGAAGVAYVTQRTLQEQFPPPAGAISAAYSSLELDDRWFADVPKREFERPRRLVSLGYMYSDVKGFDLLIDALGRVHREGHDFRLTMVGDGRLRPDLEQLAASVGIAHLITFAGALSGPRLRDALLGSDLFVLSSRSEGLPRSVVEAMAVGLPSVGTRAGGAVELLRSDVACAPTVDGLVDLLRKALGMSDVELASLASHDHAVSQRFRRDQVVAERTQFYASARRRAAGDIGGGAHPPLA